MQNYHHLSAEERAVIMLGVSKGESLRSISQLLNRSPSTLSREVNRNRPSSHYDATVAGKNYQANRKRSVKPQKIVSHLVLSRFVYTYLVDKKWSPMQISGTLKKLYSTDPLMQVSHQTLYRHIHAYPKGELKKSMIKSLRLAKNKPGFRGDKTRFSSLKIEEHQRIVNRPQEINGRGIPGHWEGDLIVGAMNRSCVGTLVDRKTGYLVLSKMASKSATDVRLGFEKQMHHLPDFLRLSMTYDRGAEMAQHPIMSKNLQMQIYFADPHAPWQRGSSENINGLIRQFLPKGTDLSPYSQSELDHIAWLLNTRPRQRFEFQTPQELFEQILDENLNAVALDS